MIELTITIILIVAIPIVLCAIAFIAFLHLGLLPRPPATHWLSNVLPRRSAAAPRVAENYIRHLDASPPHPLLFYLQRHCRILLVAALAGIFFDLAILPWLLRVPPVRSLVSSDWQTILSLCVVVAAILILATPKSYDFLKRYRRSTELTLAKPHVIDILAVGFTTAVLFLMYSPEWRNKLLAAGPAVLIPTGILAVWLTALILASRIRGALRTAPAPSKFRPYSDEPISADRDDILGRTDFVQGLYSQLEALPFPASFVIGLYAGWGEGKTSVLNLLARRVEANPNLIAVRFNPWYFPNENALIRNFYDGVEAALQRHYSLPGLRAFLDRYENLLTFGLGFEAFRIKLRVRESAEELREDLEGRLGALPSRLVILVDDIDRLQPSETLAVLKLCRLSARLRNTIFVLSLDPLVVRQLIREAKADPEYLDKIIQKPVPLPPADQDAIDRYLLFSDPRSDHRSAIDVFLDAMNIREVARRAFDERIVEIYQNHLRRFFRTLRQAKRYLNGLQSTVPPIVDEVDLGDAFLLEFIQVFFPHVYQDIWRNRWMYLPAWTTQLLLASPFSVGEKEEKKYAVIKDHIAAVLSDLGEQERRIVLAVLKDLFFVEVRNAYAGARTNHSGNEHQYRADKRITHPDCFARYFLLRPAGGEVTDSAVEALIDSWQADDGGRLADRVVDDLGRFQEAGKLTEVLHKLRIFMQRIDETHAPMIVRGLYRLVDRLEIPSVMTFSSDYDAVEALVLRLIADRVEEAHVAALMEEVVGRVAELHFAVLVVLSCHRAAQGSLFRIRDNVDLTRLRRIAADRLRAHYVAAGRDIFGERPPREWSLILYQWGTDWMTNSGEHRAEVQEYVKHLWERNPIYLGIVLVQFVEKWHGDRVGFRLAEFAQLFEPSTVKNLVKRYGNAVISSPETKEAVDVFTAAVGGPVSSASPTTGPRLN